MVTLKFLATFFSVFTSTHLEFSCFSSCIFWFLSLFRQTIIPSSCHASPLDISSTLSSYAASKLIAPDGPDTNDLQSCYSRATEQPQTSGDPGSSQALSPMSPTQSNTYSPALAESVSSPLAGGPFLDSNLAASATSACLFVENANRAELDLAPESLRDSGMLPRTSWLHEDCG
ncbi:unnamed protein product [Protopolystoma xenopodis]|uniref:Uncharacterized protein n=1 Tax=Protopolystoma xenopodis TaxID=117903 RepID=A0A448WJK8_9PLAT|nr:unnamed protein product [Protopolystoma xenopodis]